jgi:hypothetical protein
MIYAVLEKISIKMKTQEIPNAREPDHIERKNFQKIEGWKTWFKNLSSRIVLIDPKEVDFDELEKETKKYLRIMEGHRITDWPKQDNVAFIVQYDSARPGEDPEIKLGNAFLFLYNGYAFSLSHFNWDGGPEEEGFDSNSETFSLDDYPDSALSYKFISGVIERTIRSIEKQTEKIPDAPE